MKYLNSKAITLTLLLLAGQAFAGELVVKVMSLGEPLTGALVVAVDHDLRTRTDKEGLAQLSLPEGNTPIRVSLAGFAAKVVAADVPGSVEIDLGEHVFVTEMVVVGSRGTPRTALESTAPVDVLPAEELIASGLTETNQILEMLVPSFNFPRPTVTDGTDHVRPATLRGLNPDHVLVLVNGKRRHASALINVNGSIGRGSAAVDLNAIPVAAIDRIEVLRDGAAALYGTDAIAGVINIILKEGPGGMISANTGVTAEGDGERQHLDAAYGWEFGSGFVKLSAEVDYRDPTNRSGPDPRQQYFSEPDGSDDPRESGFDRINHRYGDADVESTTFFFNSGYKTEKGLELYAFGNLGSREGESAGFYRRALDNRNVRALYPDGYLPLITSEIEDTALVIGARAAYDKWSFDISFNRGENEFEFGVDNSLNASLGNASPTSFKAGSLAYEQRVINLDLVREIATAGSKPMHFAFGVALREEAFEIEAGEPASYENGGTPVLDGPNAGATTASGSQVFPGFRPSDEVDEDRKNFSAYGELSFPLGERGDASVAMRLENYSDFGSTNGIKAAARYEVLDDINLRGAYSTGYRAPSLAQSFYATTATNFIDGTPFEVRTFPVNDPAARALGATDLSPEKSANKSLGVTGSFRDHWQFSLDGYIINISDRIVLSENMTGPLIRDILADNGITGVNGGRYFTNAIDTKTEGVDLVVRHAYDLFDGKLRSTLGLNVNSTSVTAVAPNPSELIIAVEGRDKPVEIPMFGRTEIARIEEGQPDHKLHLSFDYSRANYSLLLRATRFGEVTSRNNADPTRDQTFGAKTLTDLVLNYRFRQRMTFSIGGNNIFDVYPDENIAPNSFNGIFRYNNISPFGFNGAYYFGKITLNL